MAQLGGIFKQTNPQIVKVLESESEVLARIQTDFHNLCKARAKNNDQAIEITCFYEELPLPGIGIVSVPATVYLSIIPGPSMGILPCLGCSFVIF